MPAHFDSRVFDNGLTVLDTEANEIWICSGAAPTSYGAANTAKLGTKTLAAGGIGAPGAGTPDGRAVTVAAFSDGTVTATGTAGSYAIVDTVNSRLLVSQALTAPQAVTNGNTFSLLSFPIRIPAATA